MENAPNLHVVDSLGQPVGELWQKLQSEYIHNRGSFNFSSPLSSTPLPIYDWTIDHADSFPWGGANFVLMDEQVEGTKPPFQYIDTDDPASYEGFAKTHLLDKLPNELPILKPDLEKLNDFVPHLRLLILAVGVRGNYANVMPGTPLNTGWHIAELIDEFKQTPTQHGAYTGATFRTHGMSLGPQQVLKADHVVVIASGPAKRELVRQMLAYTDFDPSFPISIVHHPAIRERVQFYITPDTLGEAT